MKRRKDSTADTQSDSGGGRHVPRLFVDSPLGEGLQVALDRDQLHRLVTVMRRKAGDAVVVFNGRDGEWHARLAQVTKKAAVLDIGGLSRPQPVPSGITLAFAPLKHTRLDYVAQKAAEMGVAHIVPVVTRHTVAGRFNAERFRANVVEGAEQCGVLWIADVEEAVALERFLARRGAGEPLVFCDEAAAVANPVGALAGIEPPLTVLIGPEGGFSQDERGALRALETAVPVSLGPRIMRADTAMVAALALVQAACGDWR